VKKVRKYLSYSNLMASFAVFLALGGAAFAVGQAKKNSVTSASIRDAAVTGKDVKDDSLTGLDVDEATLSLDRSPTGPAGGDLNGTYPNPQIRPQAVGTAEIADGSISGVKLALDSVDGANIKDNTVGSSDLVDGSVGTAEVGLDAIGASELKGMNAVVGQGVVVGAGTPKTATVKCPGTAQVIGGGYAWLDEESNSIIVNAPSEGDPNQSWQVRGMVDAGTNTLFAWANCMAN